jgi:hypothetical protein
LEAERRDACVDASIEDRVVQRGGRGRHRAVTALQRDGYRVALAATTAPNEFLRGPEPVEAVILDIADANALDAVRQLRRIRRKVEPDPRRPRYFLTVPGVGLRFDPEERSRQDEVPTRDHDFQIAQHLDGGRRQLVQRTKGEAEVPGRTHDAE